MSLLVMKFGGTSVGNAEAIAGLAGITRDHLRTYDHVAIVVSAMSGVTDLLFQGAHTAAAGDRLTYLDIARRLRDKHRDTLAALIGEPGAVGEQVEQLIDEFELLCHSVTVLGEASPRALDAISSLGERMSARIVAATLHARGIASEALDATELVLTTAHFGGAVPQQPQTRERTRAR